MSLKFINFHVVIFYLLLIMKVSINLKTMSNNLSL